MAQLKSLLSDIGFIVAMMIALVVTVLLLKQCITPRPNAPAYVQRDSVVQQRDAVFIHDTTRIARVRPVYRSVARAAKAVADSGHAVAPDTVLRLVSVGDTLATLDSTAIENCARLVQAQKKLIASLVPPAPRLDYFIQPMYSLADGDIIVQGGAEYRLFGGVSLVAGAQVGQQRALFVGARITFR